MLFNVSYNNKDITRQINEAVGLPYPFRERLKMKGVGSPRLIITACSPEIQELLDLDNNRNYGNIELRPEGIIIGFRALLESYAFVIPYYYLAIFKGEAEAYTLNRNQLFVKFEVRRRDKGIHRFMKKLMDQKAAYATG